MAKTFRGGALWGGPAAESCGQTEQDGDGRRDAVTCGRPTPDGEWVRAQLIAISEWGERSQGCDQLLAWLWLVVKRRARDVAEPDRSDVVQDAIIEIVSAVRKSLPHFVEAGNPAALLERVADRAVGHARHRTSMSGFGGVSANGRNWRKRYPRHLGGEAAMRVLTGIPSTPRERSVEVEKTASRVAEYVLEEVGVELSADAIDALVYVLDRLVAGVRRATLVRGGHSALRADPAMTHLGFCPGAAGAFARWLLGRDDGQRETPSVLDAFLDGERVAPAVAVRWRRQALAFGFVADADDPTVADVAGGCRSTA